MVPPPPVNEGMDPFLPVGISPLPSQSTAVMPCDMESLPVAPLLSLCIQPAQCIFCAMRHDSLCKSHSNGSDLCPFPRRRRRRSARRSVRRRRGRRTGGRPWLVPEHRVQRGSGPTQDPYQAEQLQQAQGRWNVAINYSTLIILFQSNYWVCSKGAMI